MVSAIMKRRSIRKFTEEKVSADSAMRIVEAGAAAPSAMNRRPVRFILLDKEAMARFAEKVAQKEPLSRVSGPSQSAPTAGVTTRRAPGLRTVPRQWRIS